MAEAKTGRPRALIASGADLSFAAVVQQPVHKDAAHVTRQLEILANACGQSAHNDEDDGDHAREDDLTAGAKRRGDRGLGQESREDADRGPGGPEVAAAPALPLGEREPAEDEQRRGSGGGH